MTQPGKDQWLTVLSNWHDLEEGLLISYHHDPRSEVAAFVFNPLQGDARSGRRFVGVTFSGVASFQRVFGLNKPARSFVDTYPPDAVASYVVQGIKASKPGKLRVELDLGLSFGEVIVTAEEVQMQERFGLPIEKGSSMYRDCVTGEVFDYALPFPHDCPWRAG